LYLNYAWQITFYPNFHDISKRYTITKQIGQCSYLPSPQLHLKYKHNPCYGTTFKKPAHMIRESLDTVKNLK